MAFSFFRQEAKDACRPDDAFGCLLAVLLLFSCLLRGILRPLSFVGCNRFGVQLVCDRSREGHGRLTRGHDCLVLLICGSRVCHLIQANRRPAVLLSQWHILLQIFGAGPGRDQFLILL